MMKPRLYTSTFYIGLRWLMLGLLVLAAPALMAQSSAILPAKKPTKVISKSRVELKTQANQMATGIRAAEAALSPAELAIAQRIEVGPVQCELGASVTVTADPKVPGYFNVQGKKFRFRMAPVVTSTGAIRLEDVQSGAVWLQLANKSMLMDQKSGSRLADACVTSTQALVALAMEKSPLPGLLDSPVVHQTILPTTDLSPANAMQ